jgi:N utilization substance protein B
MRSAVLRGGVFPAGLSVPGEAAEEEGKEKEAGYFLRACPRAGRIWGTDMGRHEQREQIFKLLFRVEYHSKEDMPEQVRLFLADDELVLSERAAAYITGKYENICEKLPELDRLINQKVEGWDTGRIGRVELTVLRLAVFEILYDGQVPDSVAINEAVEISKKYGQDNSGGFVNAILAKFVKDR